MPSDRQAEIQARVERAGAFADGDIEWLLAELSRVQQERDEAAEDSEHWKREAHNMCEMARAIAAERDALQQEIATLRQQIEERAARAALAGAPRPSQPNHEDAADIYVPGRQAKVRALLREFRATYGTWPTANELLRFARTTHPECAAWDVNSVRPRLTEMVVQGDVGELPYRRCAVTGKRVTAYIHVEKPLPLPVENLAAARAQELF